WLTSAGNEHVDLLIAALPELTREGIRRNEMILRQHDYHGDPWCPSSARRPVGALAVSLHDAVVDDLRFRVRLPIFFLLVANGWICYEMLVAGCLDHRVSR